MAEDLHSVVVETTKETEGVERAFRTHLRDSLVHQVDGFVGENLLLAGDVVFEMEHGKTNEIVRAGINRRSS